MTYLELNSENLNPHLQQQAALLFGQLTNAVEAIPLDTLLTNNAQLTVLGCMEGDKLLGMGSMATYRVVSGYKGWIEDVVVDQAQRGRGIGRELMKQLLDKGRQMGLNEILLFTAYHRKPAIALYESLGFKKKDSYLYVLKTI